jgi:hypothetical protein
LGEVHRHLPRQGDVRASARLHADVVACDAEYLRDSELDGGPHPGDTRLEGVGGAGRRHARCRVEIVVDLCKHGDAFSLR